MSKTPGWDIRRGKRTVRVNKMRNRRSKRVHWLVFIAKWNAYIKACRNPDELELLLGGENYWGNVSQDTEVSCKACLKIKWLNG